MIDLETMGNSTQAPIVAIGACFFSPLEKGAGRLGEHFYCNVDLDSAVQAGGVVDADTVVWWSQQSQEAQDALKENPLEIEDALNRFTHFVQNFRSSKLNVWSHATFDHVIITETYRRSGMRAPFHFRDARDIRTLNYLAGSVRTEFVGTAHNALDDCFNQIKYCTTMIRRIKLGKLAESG